MSDDILTVIENDNLASTLSDVAGDLMFFAGALILISAWLNRKNKSVEV